MSENEPVEWDEFLQGYDTEGRLVVCICGFRGDMSTHYCPYDQMPEEEDDYLAAQMAKTDSDQRESH
jgi:hypothetical protein